MRKYTEAEIISELRKGNTQVFEALYVHFNKVTGFIRQNSGSEEDAKDFFHEALIVFYQKLRNNEFQLDSKLSTYLFAVCKNMWLMHLRKNKSTLFNSFELKPNELKFDKIDIEEKEEIIDNEKKLEAILEKIKHMKEPCYSILMMFYFNKMSYKHIAEKLNYENEKSVKNQKYRCIQRIKDSLPKQF